MIFLNQIESTIRQTVASQASGCSYIILELRVGSTVYVRTSSRKIGSYYEFPGVEELVKALMLQNNLAVFSVTAVYYVKDSSDTQIDTYSSSLSIIYTGAELRKPGTLTADVFASVYFLTHYKSAWTTPSDSYLLNYYAASDENYTIVRTFKDGTTATATGTATAGTSTIPVNYLTDCVSAVVTMGSRTFTLYFLDIDIAERFQFRNAFNALESVVVPAATTEAPKTEYETAQQENVLQRYDIEEQLDVKIQTPPLPEFMRQTLLDMCRSHYVERLDSYRGGNTTYQVYSPVIIKEYKFDKTNEPNKPLVLELTLQYSNTKRNSAIEFG